jgi:hypothetical protein
VLFTSSLTRYNVREPLLFLYFIVQIYMLLHPPAGAADEDVNWLGADIMTMPVPGAV